MLGDRNAAQPCRTRARRHDSAKDSHGRALACAVGAEEADNFTAIDSKADVLNRLYRAKAAAEVLNTYACGAFHE